MNINMKKKPIISIELDEIIRNKWVKFDRLYVEEFGEEGTPEQPYVFEYFDTYKWNDVTEEFNVLKDDIPEELSPLDYQLDENGESLADPFLFTKEKIELTKEEVFNRFMYEDYCFEIFGASPVMYRGIDLHLKKFLEEFKDYTFNIVSKENQFTIPPTLFFIGKSMCRFKNYKFYDNYNEYWDDCDILITTNPYFFKEEIPEGKILIKMKRPYNEDCVSEYEYLQLYDLINDDKFKELIENYGK